MTGYLVDTSIFVAIEQGRKLGDPPEGEARVSVATLTEILAGARAMTDPATREKRAETEAHVRRFIALPYDEPVAEHMAALLVAARERRRRASPMDLIIAATAIVHGLEVWTQDDDFRVLAELSPELRIHRG